MKIQLHEYFIFRLIARKHILRTQNGAQKYGLHYKNYICFTVYLLLFYMRTIFVLLIKAYQLMINFVYKSFLNKLSTPFFLYTLK